MEHSGTGFTGAFCDDLGPALQTADGWYSRRYKIYSGGRLQSVETATWK